MVSGFTGRVRDATCSVSSDAEQIFRELAENELESEVDFAIKVLINTGISTPELRDATKRAGNLRSAKVWTIWPVVFAGYWFVYEPSVILHKDVPPAEACLSWVKLLGSLAWICLFCGFLDVYRRGFAVNALMLAWLVSFFWFVVMWIVEVFIRVSYVSRWNQFMYAKPYTEGLLVPVVLAISVVGPGPLARIPLIGPCLVGWLFAKNFAFCRSFLCVCEQGFANVCTTLRCRYKYTISEDDEEEDSEEEEDCVNDISTSE